MKYKKICKNCEKEFICYYEKSKYCSNKCKIEKEGLELKICPKCKKEFKPTWHGQIHCNKNCYAKSLKLKKQAKNSKLIKNNKDNKYHLGYLKDNVSYGALHDWVRYHKTKTEKCELCGAKECGYKDGRDFELANISGEYKRDLNDFVWLCYKCHMRFDKIKKSKPYEVIGVEVKSNGYLDKEEKAKCKWLLEKKIFTKILIAKKSKVRGKIDYKEFK